MEPETGFHGPDTILGDLQSTEDDAHSSRNIIRTICAVICLALLLILAATALSAEDGFQDNQTVHITAGDVFREYWYWMVIIAAAMAAMMSATIFFIRLNRRLCNARLELQERFTEHKQGEESLRNSEAKFRILYETTSDAVMLLDEKGFFDCNDATLRIFGMVDKEEFCRSHPSDLSPPKQPCGTDSTTFANGNIAKAMQEGSYRFEHIHRRKDGTDFPAEVLLNNMTLNDRMVLQAVVRDISERKEAEKELLAARAEVESLLGSISSVMIGLDRNDLITLWNRPAEKIFGINTDNAMGKTFRYLKIDWEWEKLVEKIDLCREKSVETQIDELTFKAPDGSEYILAMKINQVVEPSGKVTGILISGADVTERRSLEKQLNQAQKLESIGQLAAGIAHEINTPTQYVGDNARFLQESFGDLERAIEKCLEFLASAEQKNVSPEVVNPVREAFEAADMEYLMEEIPRAIEQSLEGIGRVTRIVRAMKSFSHPGTEAKAATNLNKLIESTVTVCRNEWKYVSDLTMTLDEDLPLVYCLPGELNQVILNLIMNASQAIQELVGETPEQKGAITVKTKLDGEWADIRIGDTGGGIPKEIASKVFDLFFTTKEAGKGTGQGLSIARDVVVMKHSGLIDFETQAGEGTTFIIRLPIRPPEMVEDIRVKEAANAA